jgi:DNA-binding MarR family transcriptional regulator
MTNTLKRLEARGCVRVEPDATDGRSKQVSLTRRGGSLRERAVRSMAGDLALVQKGLDAQALVALLPQLQGLRAWLDSQRD